MKKRRVLSLQDPVIAGKWIIRFAGHRNPVQIGQAFLNEQNPGHWVLQAVDIKEEYQRQGYGTLLMRRVRKFLRVKKAEHLHSSNSGSGTVQLLEKAFDGEDVRHYANGHQLTKAEAIKIMDVDFGYTRTSVRFLYND